MSTKVLSKTYIRSYIHAYYQEGLVELLQQASFDSWLGYPTRLQLLPPLFHTRYIYFIVSLPKQPLLFIYVIFIILQTYPTTPTKYF